MTRRNGRRRVALAALLVLVGGACESEPSPDEEPTAVDTGTAPTAPGAAGVPTEGRVDGTLRIGTVLPQTGDLAQLGPSLVEAVRLAVEEINEAGGVLGKDVDLRLGDSGTDEQMALGTVEDLLAQEVDVIVGAASDRITLAIVDRVTRSQTAMCSPSNTTADLTTLPDDGFYFRTAPPDGLQALALADVIAGEGHERVAILAVEDDFGLSFSMDLREALDAKEDVRVVSSVSYPVDAREHSSYLRGLVRAEPDAVVIVAFEDTGAPALRALIDEELGPQQIGVYGPDSMQRVSLGEVASPDDPSVAHGVSGTAPAAEGSDSFRGAFSDFAPENTPEIFSAHAYDCVVLLALAALETNTDDPVAISQALIDLTKEGEKCTSFEQCKGLIEDGEDIDYDGASGELEFTEAGEPGTGTYEVWEYVVRDDIGGIETTRTFTIAREEAAS